MESYRQVGEDCTERQRRCGVSEGKLQLYERGEEPIIYRKPDETEESFRTLADVLAYCLRRIETLEQKVAKLKGDK